MLKKVRKPLRADIMIFLEDLGRYGNAVHSNFQEYVQSEQLYDFFGQTGADQ